jgi:hypothetical protein
MNFLLQPLITVRGNASTSGQSITQDVGGWLDVGDAVDLAWGAQVTAVTQPTGGTVTLNLETAPNKDDASFMPIIPPVALQTGSGGKSVLTPTTVPLARWLRWRLSVPGGSTGIWDVTMRIEVATSPFSYFIPTQVSGCVGWFRSDLGISLDGSGNVQQWNDQSGNGFNVSQGTAANRPGYVTTQSTPALHWTTTSQGLLDSGGFTPLSQPIEYFVVASESSTSAGVLVDTNAGTGCSTFANGLNINVSNGGTQIAGPPILASTPFVSDSIFNGSTSSIAVNGGTPVTGNLSTTGTGTSLAIGERTTGGVGWLGNIQEVVFYSRKLSASERTRVLRYLGGRYGIPVP